MQSEGQISCAIIDIFTVFMHRSMYSLPIILTSIESRTSLSYAVCFSVDISPSRNDREHPDCASRFGCKVRENRTHVENRELNLIKEKTNIRLSTVFYKDFNYKLTLAFQFSIVKKQRNHFFGFQSFWFEMTTRYHHFLDLK